MSKDTNHKKQKGRKNHGKNDKERIDEKRQ
nr:MAG TPA: hypothetical protein [Caudoviricetes sp.]